MSVSFSRLLLRVLFPPGMDAHVPKLLWEGCPRPASGTFGPEKVQQDLLISFFPAKGLISDHCYRLVLPLDL